MADSGARAAFGERAFARLGRGLVRHPWYPIAFWIVLLLIALPLLPRIGSVTTNSATALPSSAPSAQAQSLIDRTFANRSGGADSILLVTGPNVTSAAGEAVVQNLTAAIGADPHLSYVAGITSYYTAYAGYLNGTATIASATLVAAVFPPAGTLPGAVSQSAALVWGPPAQFLADWAALVAGHPGTSPANWSYPAYLAAQGQVGGNASAAFVLSTFYNGTPPGTSPAASGFNGSADCAAVPATASNCSEWVVRSAVAAILPTLVPDPTQRAVPQAVLAGLGIANFTSAAAQRTVTLGLLSARSGLSAAWIGAVWSEFPNGSTPAGLAAWTAGIAGARPVPGYAPPVPRAIREQFLDASGTAELVIVSYNVSDSFTTSGGANPVFDDVSEIQRLLPAVLATADPTGAFQIVQTGGAPLDQTEQNVLAASLALVLPLTVIVLVAITMLYFRAPAAPALTFGGLGIALALGLAGVVVVGTLITHVDTTALTLQNTFVLGVGTDYSIFLVARYREELWKGVDPKEAVITTVTWAGQSIATSGATAALATLALAFSGVALLSQWGMVLSLAVLIAVLVSLTIVPAFLVLVGPRVFWPYTGERFRRHAVATVAARAEERTYFFRVGRGVRKRPATVVGLALLASVPLLFVALTAPISYDFFGQLPGGHPATDGLTTLSDHFGAGRAFPTIALVTFAAPLVVQTTPNVTEFTDLDELTRELNATPGVALVDAPSGPWGASLAAWVGLGSAPPATQALLTGTLANYLGSDQRTVWMTVYTTSGGLSASAVALLGTLRSTASGFAATHPEIVGVLFGGGAAETSDIRDQTSLATERMAIAVSVGLILVLLAVLRSYWIPPMAVATIGLSIGWAWGVTNLVLQDLAGIPMFYFVPTVLFILILGLGIDYNIFLLTRVREERLRGRSADEATVHGLAATGGIISAAAVILASAFLILTTGEFLLLRAIGFAVAAAVVLDAMIVRTYLVPALLFLLGERVWHWPRWPRRRPG